MPLDDVAAGLSWLRRHALELGIDANRIAVMGESAGAGLAAAVTLLCREKGRPKIAKQILVYPMLDDRSINPDAHLEGLLTWTHEDNLTRWTAYLGEKRGQQDVSETAAPARRTDATGLPATYIEVGGLDIFRNEVVEFASKIAKAGISVELHVRPGVPHGFEYFKPRVYHATRAIEDRVWVISTIF